jgi:hypothetical protein
VDVGSRTPKSHRNRDLPICFTQEDSGSPRATYARERGCTLKELAMKDLRCLIGMHKYHATTNDSNARYLVCDRCLHEIYPPDTAGPRIYSP